MNIIIIGAGGQARIVYEVLKLDYKYRVVKFWDSFDHLATDNIDNISVVGGLAKLSELLNVAEGAVVAIGDNKIRAEVYRTVEQLGYTMINAIHPSAVIAPSVSLGNGIMILMGALISTRAKIGNNVIINTGAVIEHDNSIGNNVHIASGCNLAGGVIVKDGAFIGIGTVIKEYLTIGENSIVGAGSVVLNDIPDNSIVAGIPAKSIKDGRD